MKYLFIILWCLSINGYADRPTYKTAPIPKKYATGLLKHEKMESELLEFKFEKAAGDIPKAFHLKERVELAPVKDQGSCGSCVYNATVGALEDIHRLRGTVLPTLSRQFLMDCGAPWSCGGSFFEKVAQGLLEQGGTPTESDYPYRAYDQSCKGKPSLLGKIASYKLISNSQKSIMAAVYAGYPVAVTVGADNRWMSYAGGIYNGCTGQSTNHEVVVEGYDCETSVDANGNCVFDTSGRLPYGIGVYHIRNSWGSSWGDKGWIATKITTSSGRLCNSVSEEAGILEPELQPKPPEPPKPPTPPEPISPSFWLWMVVVIVGIISVVSLILGLRK